MHDLCHLFYFLLSNYLKAFEPQFSLFRAKSASAERKLNNFPINVLHFVIFSGLQQQQPNERQVVPDGRSLVQREVENHGENVQEEVCTVGQHVQSETSQEGRRGRGKTAVGTRPRTFKGRKRFIFIEIEWGGQV